MCGKDRVKEINHEAAPKAASEHVAHPDGQLAVLRTDIDCGIGKARRAHPDLGIARKPEAFLRHHPQGAIGLAVRIFVMEQGYGILPWFHVGKREGDAAFSCLRRRTICARHAAAARKRRFVRGHAGTDDTFGIAQIGNRDRYGGPFLRWRS